MTIIVIHSEEVKTKYNLKYNGKMLKRDKDVNLQENSFLLLQERSIFANKFIYVVCRVFLEIYILLRSFATCSDKADPEIKPIKKIQINYHKILNEELIIKILKDNVEVTGLEIESIVINGIKVEEPRT